VLVVMPKLGTAFGGPAVHVAMLRDETVRRRAGWAGLLATAAPGWLDTRQVLDGVIAGQITPGRCSPPRPSSATCSAASPPPWSRPPRSSRRRL
jgi:hypothetical protein